MENRWENNGNSERLFSWAPKSPWTVTVIMKLKEACSLEKKLWETRVLKSRGIILATKVRIVKATIFPLVMYRCESGTKKKAERWTIHAFKLWCWKRLLRVPWTARRSNQSILKEIRSWIFIGRTDAETEAPILWLPDVKSQFTGKDPDAGKDWGHEEKGATEDKMVGWHHQLNGHEVAEAHGVEKIQTWLSNWITTAKETINKTKRPPTEWEKILANNMSDKGFTLKICK